MKVGLIGCCKSKLTTSAEAQYLYVSDSFKKMKAYAEMNYDDWAILSALFGLVAPEQVIEPYAYTLNGKGYKEQKQWAKRVVSSIMAKYPGNTAFYLFAGMSYRKVLVPLLEASAFTVHIPLEGLGIGEQKAWLKRMLM